MNREVLSKRILKLNNKTNPPFYNTALGALRLVKLSLLRSILSTSGCGYAGERHSHAVLAH